MVKVKRSSADTYLRQERDLFIPSLSITNQHNLSIGRVLDPTTYQFITNRTVHDMSAYIGGSLTLFSGLERLYQVKKAELGLRSVELDEARTKNELSLEVTRLFLEILMDKETIEICENKVELLKKQEELIAQRVALHASTTGDLLNVQADITRAEIELSNAMNQLNLDKVEMCGILNIDDWKNFDVTFDKGQDIEPRLWDVTTVLIAAQSLPQIRQKEVAIQQAKRDIQISSSSYWPTIKLNVGYGSTYSNARVKTTGEDYVFYDQLRDNRSAYVTASLSIPIFSAITVSHSVRAKKQAVELSELELQQTLISLDKEVKQAVIQTNTAYEKYNLLAKEVEKGAEALRQTEAKYSVGAATYYDFQIAVGNLFQSQAERLRARYEYIYWIKIMHYYSGDSLL